MAAPDPSPRISCRLEVLPGATVADQLAAAGRFGFDGVALPGRYRERWLTPLRACRATAPFPLAGLSLGFEHSLLSSRVTERRRCRDSLLRLLDLCAELGAGWVNMPPCLTADNPDRLRDPGGHGSLATRLDELLCEQLPALGDAAQERGVWLLLEPVNRYESDYLNTLAHAARLGRELAHPAIGCTADFFHMQLEELHPAAALAAAMDQVRHVHVAENTRVEPGPGSLDFRPGFTVLRAAGYRGWIEVECRALSGPAEIVLPAAVRHLRAAWAA